MQVINKYQTINCKKGNSVFLIFFPYISYSTRLSLGTWQRFNKYTLANYTAQYKFLAIDREIIFLSSKKKGYLKIQESPWFIFYIHVFPTFYLITNTDAIQKHSVSYIFTKYNLKVNTVLCILKLTFLIYYI